MRCGARRPSGSPRLSRISVTPGKTASRGRAPRSQIGSGERQPDGAFDLHRCAAARVGQADHRGYPVFRLRPARPQAGAAHPDLRSEPASGALTELLICIDALRRASAKRITAVIPYFGYARQDRKPGPRTPISAKLVANLITVAGASRVLSIDLHAGQIQGFFDIPTDNLFASPVIAADIQARFSNHNLTVVSPDVGGVVRARSLAKRLDNAPLAIIDKRRERAGESEVMNIIGDVDGRSCILIDDIVDSGGTLCNAAAALRQQGEGDVVAYCAHA